MRSLLSRWLAAGVLCSAAVGVLVGVVAGASSRAADEFDHLEHAGLFPACAACHRGAEERSASMFPEPASCFECHDGVDDGEGALETVDWKPSGEPRPTNLVFDHLEHADTVATEGDERVGCVGCHAPEGAAWMTVARADVRQCLSCHELPGEHLALAPEACATCHTDLAESPLLQREQIAAFAAPESHEAPDFALDHPTRDASCAVCHARDFCVQCHVNAPEVEEIAALAPDERSLALTATVPEPVSHAMGAFLENHGSEAIAADATCAACHTAGSCTTCHVGSPQLAAGLPTAGPGRGAGALVVRNRPPSHDLDFLAAHGPAAATRPETCAGCHVRSDCTECHRPGAAVAAGFHPPDFATRHPASAYARETSCSNCHSTGEFCQTCHAASGLGGTDVLGSEFHDGQAAFVVGHGAPARQALETCASCHVERDCLACHSSVAGRGIDPHGPDFDADVLRRANPQMCVACHAELPAIP